VRAVSLHPDVLVVSSALLRANCVIVRGSLAGDDAPGAEQESPVQVIEPGSQGRLAAESFVIDSPVLPDELEALPALLEQARFPSPSGLLCTHGDWDHLLGRLAFPGLVLGCAQSTAARIAASPGEAQRELRSFDEDLGIDRPSQLALGSVQGLPVPGRCEIGDQELALHPAEGHTGDGMAVHIPWAAVLVAGDYLSPVEIPLLGSGGGIEDYLATLTALRLPLAESEHVVPGHGAVIGRVRAESLLEEDLRYLDALRDGSDAELPEGRRGRLQKAIHEQNLAALA
jgi:glyoxylase-like metal-dependent hydrolase (beta-lactamase superfamily II)